HFQAFDEDARPVKPEKLAKPSAVHVLMSVRPDGRAMSFFGDLHPSFSGNVVKAMASAKQGYPVITRTLDRIAPCEPPPAQVLEMGGSSDLCALLKPGEPVVLMGPTGTPTETPEQETVLLAGGGLGNAVLFSIGQSLRANGSRVVYFAGYKKMIDRYKVADIE